MKKSNIVIYACAILAGYLVYNWISNYGSDLEIQIVALERENDSLKSELLIPKPMDSNSEYQNNLKPAGYDFYYGNISVMDERELIENDGSVIWGPGISILGEITNKSEKRFISAEFIVTIFDLDGKLLAVQNYYTDNFLPLQTKSFTVKIEKITTHQIRVKLQTEQTVLY